MLRALRRRADLSQRELAGRAGVPKSTVARIESGGLVDPRFRTVERLVRAAGGEVAVGVAGRDRERLAAVPPVPHDGWRDDADRRYPAHLDVREVRTLKDWPGAWWADWYNLPPERWPLPVPPATYDLDRRRRDRRREVDRILRCLRYRRDDVGLPATSWRLVAELPDGALVGELRAHERSVDLLSARPGDGARELVLDGVLVAPGLHRVGIGRRLVTLLVEGMDRAGIGAVHAIAEGGGVEFLLACDFRLGGSRLWTLSLRRPPGRRGPPPPNPGR
ncbi:Acetyltransferase (GNAT) family protein [Micromonospora echinospora]|uniref:Acetyltransferase (GNAT) family protein n=1 Tax=Micromonospora echinospora TaxID=1877 RepID=A0A1C4VRV8_MICEC|nr:helix-turn-helix transcriptional regulator [Micromonospora echinospora]SCE86706.1 Acetyltransferase (GNAT) family protein [Micromonospora echinospora]